MKALEGYVSWAPMCDACKDRRKVDFEYSTSNSVFMMRMIQFLRLDFFIIHSSFQLPGIFCMLAKSTEFIACAFSRLSHNIMCKAYSE